MNILNNILNLLITILGIFKKNDNQTYNQTNNTIIKNSTINISSTNTVDKKDNINNTNNTNNKTKTSTFTIFIFLVSIIIWSIYGYNNLNLPKQDTFLLFSKNNLVHIIYSAGFNSIKSFIILTIILSFIIIHKNYKDKNNNIYYLLAIFSIINLCFLSTFNYTHFLPPKNISASNTNFITTFMPFASTILSIPLLAFMIFYVSDLLNKYIQFKEYKTLNINWIYLIPSIAFFFILIAIYILKILYY